MPGSDRRCANCRHRDAEGYCTLLSCETNNIHGGCDQYKSDLSGVLESDMKAEKKVDAFFESESDDPIQHQIDWKSGDYVTYVHRVGPSEMVGMLGFVGSF